MCLQPDSVKRNSSHCCNIKVGLLSLLPTRNRLVCAPPQPPGLVMRILSGHNSAQTQRQPQGFDTLRPSTLPHKLHNPLTRTLSPPSALLQILHISTSANKDNFNHGKPTKPTQYQLQGDSPACMGSSARIVPSCTPTVIASFQDN